MLKNIFSLFVFFLIIVLMSAGGPKGSAFARSVSFDSEPLKELALEYLDQGKFLECVEVYHQVYEYSPLIEDRAFGLVRMGDVAALFLGKKDDALNLYAQAIREFKGSKVLGNAYYNRGMIFYESGQLEKALASFSAYMRIFPQGPRSSTVDYMLGRVKEEIQQAIVNKQPVIPEPEIKPADPVKPEVPEILAEERKIRVVLKKSTGVSINLPSSSEWIWPGGKKSFGAGTYKFSYSNGAVFYKGRNYGNHLVIAPSRHSFKHSGTNYRGNAILLAKDKKLLLINKLNLETYLQGVLPKEMSPSWHIEALKAQAVAARSYANYLISKSEDKAYDVAATTASQVYGGASVGNSRTRKAVKSTHGKILTFNDRPVLSYFHAHSGGMLEDSSRVWTSSMPYYKVKADSISQKYKDLSWDVDISREDIVDALRKHGFKINQVRNIKAAERSPSGRWSVIRVETDSGPLDIRSNSLRIWLGATKIKSTLCNVDEKARFFNFSGKGYGHGVGMSQWGAQGMAVQGKSYSDILNHYYPGTKITEAY